MSRLGNTSETSSRSHLQRDPISRCARSIRALGMFALLMTASGCIVGPDYAGQSTPVPDVWHQELVNGQYANTHEVGQWWTLFDDPTLTQLIDCAEKHNVNLYAAYTRISQARSQECIVEASKKPMLSLTGGVQTSLQSPNSINLPFPGLTIPSVSIWSLGIDTGWEPDLFGRVERQLQSAEANTCGQIEAYRDVLVTLYGDVAQTYVQVRTLQQQLLIACQNVELQRSSLDLARKRVDGGVSPNVDLYQAESNLASTEAEIPRLEIQLHQTLNRLSTLLGHYPGAMHCVLAETGPIPGVPTNLPHVIPCDMVRQRPDIRQAERRIVGATADVGAAMADLMPSFRLGGNLGLNARNFGDLFSGDSFGYGLGPSFSWPILQGGRIRCNIQMKECAVEEAIANYEQTLLRASEEVENSIVGFNKNRLRAEALSRTVASAQKSLESVLALYRAGQSDFQNVLDTQRTLFQSQNALAIAQGQIITDLISFYRALGGGWDCNHHCPERCVRVHCPERCPPENVKVYCDGTNTQRYFEVPETDDDSVGAKIRNRGRNTDKTSTDGSGDGESSDNSGGRPSDKFFDDTLKELKERLKKSPPEKSPIDLDDTLQLKDLTPTTGPDASTLPAPRPAKTNTPGQTDSTRTNGGFEWNALKERRLEGRRSSPTSTRTPSLREFQSGPNLPESSQMTVPSDMMFPLELPIQDPAQTRP